MTELSLLQLLTSGVNEATWTQPGPHQKIQTKGRFGIIRNHSSFPYPERDEMNIPLSLAIFDNKKD